MLYISISILVLAVDIAFEPYTYYQTTISRTISGNVIKWSFKANNQSSIFNLDLGDLYPGVSNTYNSKLPAENVNYSKKYVNWICWNPI